MELIIAFVIVVVIGTLIGLGAGFCLRPGLTTKVFAVLFWILALLSWPAVAYAFQFWKIPPPPPGGDGAAGMATAIKDSLLFIVGISITVFFATIAIVHSLIIVIRWQARQSA